MDIERFGKSPSGKVIEVGQGEAAYHAFIPNPLPPQLEPSFELMQALSMADRALGELAGLGRNIPNPHLLITPFIRREAVLSSRIEGTETDVTDLYVYEAGQPSLPGLKSLPPESDVREVSNYVTALEYGIERLATLPVSLRLIRELHEQLMRGVRGEHATPGEFRHSQNWVGSPGCNLNDATYVPPPPFEMNEALGAFESFLHSKQEYPPLIQLALIHYQFEAIHPFLDGNGRIGRLLMSLLLIHWNLLPLPLLYLSAYLEKHRQDYYDLLLNVSREGAWNEWLAFFLVGVAEQAEDANSRARRLQDIQTEWRSRLQQAKASGLLLAVADHLLGWPLITASTVQQLFGVTHPTALQALRRLELHGIVKQLRGTGRQRLFLADTVLRLVE